MVSRKGVAVLSLVLALVLAIPAFAQQDTTPPTMTGFTFSPAQVDTTSTSATVSGTVQFADDLSGVSYGGAIFVSPSGAHSTGIGFGLSSGTNLNGTYSGTATVPAFSEPGIWTVSELYVVDNVGNGSVYFTSDLQALGYPTTFQFGATTSVALVSTPNPAVFGQPVTFTATVTASNGTTPTGTVNFNEGSTTLGTGTLDGSGTASFTTSSLALGTHSVVAAYSGDTNFGPANSATLTQTVNQADSSVGLASTANPSAFNQSVTFTATVAPQSGGTPTGSVTFSDGVNTLGTVALSGNTAGLTTSALSVGTHSITASYSGDTNFTGSTSSALAQVVSQATTTAAVTSSTNPVSVSQPVTFTATVTGQNGGTPTGTVTFKASAITLGTGTLNNGQATLTATFPSSGTRSITAVYSGDSNFVASTSPVLSQAVNKGTTSTTLTSNLNPAIFGQAVTLTATVTGGAPDGEIVTFKNGSTTLGTGSLAGGVATFSTSTLTVGSRSIRATYSGDSKLTASTSNAVSQVVQKATTTTAISSSLNPSNVGQSVTFTVTLTGQYGGTPTGTVTFTDNGATLGTATVSGGTATLTTSSLTRRSHAIKGSYSGDSSFKSSSNSLQQIVH